MSDTKNLNEEAITFGAVVKVVASCLSIILGTMSLAPKAKELKKSIKEDKEEARKESLKLGIKNTEQFIIFLSKQGKINLGKLKCSNKFKQMIDENNIERINFYWKEKFESKKDDNITLRIELFEEKYSKEYNWLINVIKRSLRYEYEDLMKFWKISMKTDNNCIILKANHMMTL